MSNRSAVNVFPPAMKGKSLPITPRVTRHALVALSQVLNERNVYFQICLKNIETETYFLDGVSDKGDT